MKFAWFLIITLLPFLGQSQNLKFKALKVQIVLNDKYGKYMLTGDEGSTEGGLDVEVNLNNATLRVANDEAGIFNIKSIVEVYKDTFTNTWTVLQCIDKDGKSCTVRLRFDLSDQSYNSYLYIDYTDKIIVYKMRKDSSKNN